MIHKKSLLLLGAALLLAVSAHAQGQVVFANRVTAAGLDAPVIVLASSPPKGPGSAYTAQLLLVESSGSLTPLLPVSTFRDVSPGATGTALLADRYWNSQIVDVPGVQPGANATFIVRAWQTSAGSFDADVAGRGESAPFTVAVGGNTLPPANLTTLQPFQVGILPEPSILALGIIGGLTFLLRKR